MSVTTAEIRSRASDRTFTLFRLVALIEGITTVLLFFVAMPVKYPAGDPSRVQMAGPVHGYAFLAYMALMVPALRGRPWSGRDRLRTALAAFLPFGTFLNNPFLKRRHAANGAYAPG